MNCRLGPIFTNLIIGREKTNTLPGEADQGVT